MGCVLVLIKPMNIHEDYSYIMLSHVISCYIMLYLPQSMELNPIFTATERGASSQVGALSWKALRGFGTKNMGRFHPESHGFVWI